MFKKRFSALSCVLIALVLCVATFVATFSRLTVSYDEKLNELKLQNKSEYGKLNELVSMIEAGFIKDYDKEQLWELVYKSLAAGLGDAYSTYMTAAEYDEFLSSGNGDFVGIGVHAVYDIDTEGIYIFGAIPDSPAFVGGIREGDVIKAVNGVEITAENYYDMLDTVRGAEGTEVRLTILRDGERISVTVTREKVVSENVMYEKLSDSTAYIRILSFADSTVSEEFEKQLKVAQDEGCEKFIFDVRNNGGGYLDEICAVLDFLLPQGVLINIVGKNGDVTTKESGESFVDAPMVVLCNGDTASAAELFTAALMDYGAAESVGTTTFGKGTMQVTKRLPDGSALKLSTYYYNPPSNVSYDGVGITPNHVVKLDEKWDNRFYKMPHSEDAQLLYAENLLSDAE